MSTKYERLPHVRSKNRCGVKSFTDSAHLPQKLLIKHRETQGKAMFNLTFKTFSVRTEFQKLCSCCSFAF